MSVGWDGRLKRLYWLHLSLKKKKKKRKLMGWRKGLNLTPFFFFFLRVLACGGKWRRDQEELIQKTHIFSSQPHLRFKAHFNHFYILFFIPVQHSFYSKNLASSVNFLIFFLSSCLTWTSSYQLTYPLTTVQ